MSRDKDVGLRSLSIFASLSFREVSEGCSYPLTSHFYTIRGVANASLCASHVCGVFVVHDLVPTPSLEHCENGAYVEPGTAVHCSWVLGSMLRQFRPCSPVPLVLPLLPRHQGHGSKPCWRDAIAVQRCMKESPLRSDDPCLCRKFTHFLRHRCIDLSNVSFLCRALSNRPFQQAASTRRKKGRTSHGETAAQGVWCIKRTFGSGGCL